jgi:hypothetical protein
MLFLNATSLLRLELAFLITFAFLLLAIPQVTVRIFGLPVAGASFWPRVLGAVCLGLAAATLATDQGWTKSGLGIGGFVAINLSMAFVLLSLLIVGPPIPTRRGKIALWSIAIGTAVFGFVEIAYIS